LGAEKLDPKETVSFDELLMSKDWGRWFRDNLQMENSANQRHARIGKLLRNQRPLFTSPFLLKTALLKVKGRPA
jgi:hypothetical protein